MELTEVEQRKVQYGTQLHRPQAEYAAFLLVLPVALF